MRCITARWVAAGYAQCLMNIASCIDYTRALIWMFVLHAAQAQSALAWGDGAADDAGLDSNSDDGGDGVDAASKERKEIEEAAEAAEAEARETAEEKRLRLARDVLMKLDAEQRENVRVLSRSALVCRFP